MTTVAAKVLLMRGVEPSHRLFAVVSNSSTSSGGIGLSSITVQQFLSASVTIPVIISPATYPAVHPVYVGGEMLPVDMLRVVAPWAVAMLALALVAVETLLIRRKKNRKP